MGFSFNGNTPKNITYNGNVVKTLEYNGVTVWKKSNPVYWYNGSSYGSGYPSTWTITKAKPNNCDHPEDCEVYYRNTLATPYAHLGEHPWSVEGYATGNTGGNEYMEIVTSNMDGYIVVNGVTISTAGTHTINVSGLSSVTMYLYLSGFEGDPGSLTVNSIRFY